MIAICLGSVSSPVPQPRPPEPRRAVEEFPTGFCLTDSQFARRRGYPTGMPPKQIRPPSKKPTAGKLRSWRVSILRGRAQPLGTVEARDERAAEVAAAAQFGLSHEQRRRLVVRAEDDAE
jgi:hypothetical protein